MNEVKSPKKPLLFYYILVLMFLLLFNLLAMPWMAEHRIQDVDYNTFGHHDRKRRDRQGGDPVAEQPHPLYESRRLHRL